MLALGAAVYVCWQMLEPFADVLLWALVLVVVFTPVHQRIEARLGSPSSAAAASTVLVIITILGPATLITVAVVNELRQVSAQLMTSEGQHAVLDLPLVQRAMGWISPYVDVQQVPSREAVIERLQQWSGVLAGGTIGLVGGVLATVVQFFLVVFTMFYLFRDGDAIRHAAYDVLPLERSQAQDVVTRTRDVIAATVYGVLLISAIQGVLGGIIFWTLGLPSPLLWGVVMFFLSMIPMAGAFLVWAPAALYLLATGAYLKGLLLVAWGILVVGSIDNFLSPRLVGKRTRLHELLIFFSVLGGLEVFGVLGLVLGPVVVALTLAILEVVRQANRTPEQTVREESVLEAQAEVRQAS
jgi:predicted PurR-regulated permease PerM